MVSGIVRDPLLHSSGVLVSSIRTDWRAMKKQLFGIPVQNFLINSSAFMDWYTPQTIDTLQPISIPALAVHVVYCLHGLDSIRCRNPIGRSSVVRKSTRLWVAHGWSNVVGTPLLDLRDGTIRLHRKCILHMDPAMDGDSLEYSHWGMIVLNGDAYGFPQLIASWTHVFTGHAFSTH